MSLQIFAIGHLNGSLSFWSLQHEQLCLGRHFLPSHERGGEVREPVFKLSWNSYPDLEECRSLLSFDTAGTPGSAPRPALPRLVGATLDYSGGETTLTILGGLSASEYPGVRVLQFPPFDTITYDSLSPTTNDHDRIDLLRHAVVPLGVARIIASQPVNDFLLVPRSSPHFNNAHDPVSIIQSFSIDSPRGTVQALEAVEFPPPISTSSSAAFQGSPAEDVDDYSAEVIELSEFSEASKSEFRLPWSVIGMEGPILGFELVRVDRDAFSSLIQHWVETGSTQEAEGLSSGRRLPLRAGTAMTDTSTRTHQVGTASGYIKLPISLSPKLERLVPHPGHEASRSQHQVCRL